jgi:hypothetical protein
MKKKESSAKVAAITAGIILLPLLLYLHEPVAVEMTVTPTNDSVLFYVFAKKLTVNWGDGAEQVYDNPCNTAVFHVYADTGVRTIRIKQNGMMHFGHRTTADSVKGTIHRIRFMRCADLSRIALANTGLEKIDFALCPSLKELRCSHNRLSILDLGGCETLRKLDCAHNLLTCLDVSDSRELIKLNCRHNTISVLSIAGCAALRELDCAHNLLTGDALEALLESLPDRQAATVQAAVSIHHNPGSAACRRSLAANKKWTVNGE